MRNNLMLRLLPTATFLLTFFFNFFLLLKTFGNGWLTIAPIAFQLVVLVGFVIAGKSKRVNQTAASGLTGGIAGFSVGLWVLSQALKHIMDN